MSKYLIALYVAVVILGGVMATPARADSMPTAAPANSIDTFVFTACNPPLTSVCEGIAHVYTWEAPSSPVPTSICTGSLPSFDRCFSIIADVAVDGSDFGLTTIRFGSPQSQSGDGGFEISALGIEGVSGTVFSGSASAPTFVPGTYTMFASDVVSPQVGQLNISTAVISTPEPTTLASLLGLGLLSLIGIRLKSKPRMESGSIDK